MDRPEPRIAARLLLLGLRLRLDVGKTSARALLRLHRALVHCVERAKAHKPAQPGSLRWPKAKGVFLPLSSTLRCCGNLDATTGKTRLKPKAARAQSNAGPSPCFLFLRRTLMWLECWGASSLLGNNLSSEKKQDQLATWFKVGNILSSRLDNILQSMAQLRSLCRATSDKRY